MVKKDNTTNVLEAKSIENFWSILKGKVYAKTVGRKCRSTCESHQYCIKQINLALTQKLAVDTKKRIDYIL